MGGALSGRDADRAAQFGDPLLLLLDLLRTLPLLYDLLYQLLLVDIVDVHAPEEVLFLVGLPEHVELLLSLDVLLQHVPHLTHLLLTLTQTGVVVLDLLFELVFDLLAVDLDGVVALVIVVLELLDPGLVGLRLDLDRLLDLLQVPLPLREPVGVAGFLELQALLDGALGVIPEALLVLLDLYTPQLLVLNQLCLD